ncbi:hypothetical protein DL771_011983 [Monosporascus sp. 5C6A]|nr:hypothetical protein DL771_011983 [Monosporascus sp. 5C6A]
MMFSPYIVFLAAAAGLQATVNAVPADADAAPSATSEAVDALKPEPAPTTQKPAAKLAPATCTTTYIDTAHSTAWTGIHLCHTHTVTDAAASCPALSCPPPPTDLICPMYIKVSSTTVPCSTDCCPMTPTTTVSSGKCVTCDPCRIPTQWITYTTGCPGVPTITTMTMSTPTYSYQD